MSQQNASKVGNNTIVAAKRSSSSSPSITQQLAPKILKEDAVQLTVNHIDNLPKSMQQLDPNRIVFELVVHATVKYYLEKNGQLQPGSVARMEFPVLNISFSPSNILFRREKFSVDFDNLRAVPGNETIPLPSTPPQQQLQPSNRVYWRYPVPPPHVVIIFEVFVGVKERRVGSSTTSWVSAGGAVQQTGSDPQGFRFLVPAETVMTNKIATRLVGLSIGQVVLTITVPTVDSAVYCTANTMTRITNLVSSLPKLNINLDEQIKACTRPNGAIDEIQLYTVIRKASNPNFYRYRLEKLLGLYNSGNQNNLARIQELLREWEGKEEYMVRQVVMELGPELSSIMARHRMTAFMKKYRLTEHDVAFAFPNGVYNTSVLEHETEKVFDVLCAKYGNEPRPTSYLFPQVVYQPDRRTYLMEHLGFPVNKINGKNWRDIALGARQKRIPFTHSPLERDVTRTSRSGRQLSEIEVLQEKHEPEFRQIIPAIADALTNVIAQHATLQRPKDERFTIYETNNVPGIQLEDYINRIAEYTYVSPSSMLASVIFLDRLCERYSSLTLTDRNIFKLFFVSVRISSKVVDLRSLNNKNFSSVGGISNKHLNELEDAFLKYIKFDLFLAPTEFSEYSRRLHPPISHSSVPRHLSSAGSAPQQQQNQHQTVAVQHESSVL